MASGRLRLHHQPAHHPRSIAASGERAMEPRELALDPRHPAPGSPSPLPRQWRRCHGDAEHRSGEPPAPGWFRLNSPRPPETGIRHQGDPGAGRHDGAPGHGLITLLGALDVLGPFAAEGLDESLGFAVGAGRVWLGLVGLRSRALQALRHAHDRLAQLLSERARGYVMPCWLNEPTARARKSTIVIFFSSGRISA